ncbi:Meiotically up-regulated gene 89 protein [Smittium culicis]|uniref:Meiotically up-regulated gene 89 protein n=1 Tax=Smittium culicis TaxID=133412 RepID=A0A1R1Y678_9FUNG|nr:Meiotically up-regulated gene 89 protein [Smittium culicis]
MSFGAKKGENKSKRPANTAFKQQRLRAWQPLLTPKTVLPTFFIIGLILAPIGGVLYWASDSLFEITLDYTDCKTYSSELTALPSSKFSLHLGKSFSSKFLPTAKYDKQSNTCSLQFLIPKDVKAPIYMYYKLTDFYQNHRRYVKSFDQQQLSGVARSASDLTGRDCDPLSTRTINGTTKPIYPCGLIANSFFNGKISYYPNIPPSLLKNSFLFIQICSIYNALDTINDLTLLNPADSSSDSSQVYNLSTNDIAWESDTYRFGKTSYKNSDVFPPPNWDQRYPYGYTDENPIPDISKDEHLHVWMRTAGLPTFRKLYGINKIDTLKNGTYQIDIVMNYDVTTFGGTKSIVIATTSAIGGRNPALGIAYISVGVLCVLLGIIFTIRHLYRPRRLGDHTYLSWNQQVQSGLSDPAH